LWDGIHFLGLAGSAFKPQFDPIQEARTYQHILEGDARLGFIVID